METIFICGGVLFVSCILGNAFTTSVVLPHLPRVVVVFCSMTSQPLCNPYSSMCVCIFACHKYVLYCHVGVVHTSTCTDTVCGALVGISNHCNVTDITYL